MTLSPSLNEAITGPWTSGSGKEQLAQLCQVYAHDDRVIILSLITTMDAGGRQRVREGRESQENIEQNLPG